MVTKNNCYGRISLRHSYAFSLIPLVSPFGHLVVDRILYESVRFHVGSNLLQSLWWHDKLCYIILWTCWGLHRGYCICTSFMYRHHTTTVIVGCDVYVSNSWMFSPQNGPENLWGSWSYQSMWNETSCADPTARTWWSPQKWSVIYEILH